MKKIFVMVVFGLIMMGMINKIILAQSITAKALVGENCLNDLDCNNGLICDSTSLQCVIKPYDCNKDNIGKQKCDNNSLLTCLKIGWTSLNVTSWTKPKICEFGCQDRINANDEAKCLEPVAKLKDIGYIFIYTQTNPTMGYLYPDISLNNGAGFDPNIRDYLIPLSQQYPNFILKAYADGSLRINDKNKDDILTIAYALNDNWENADLDGNGINDTYRLLTVTISGTKYQDGVYLFKFAVLDETTITPTPTPTPIVTITPTPTSFPTTTPTCTITTTSKPIGSATYTPTYITDSTGIKSFTSSNTAVATINASTGLITIVGTGTSVITMNIATSGNYSATSCTGIQTITTSTCATCSACAVGDTGPGGGKVFYMASGVCYEAPTSDQSAGIEWGCYGTVITGADGTAIGTGYQNTQDILAGCATRPIAASVCSSLTLGGKYDWFLPSKDELNQMYLQRSIIGGFSSNGYWSSSQHSSNNAWFQDFSYGFQFDGSKYGSGQVRCSRSF